jgi:hypothetical protein
MVSNDADGRSITPEALASFGSPRTVYIKEMLPEEVASIEGLPEAITKAEGAIKLYAVHTLDGERVAILDDRDAAFAAARQQEMEPVSVH